MVPKLKLLLSLALLHCFSVQAIDLRIDNLKVYQPTTQKFSPPSTVYVNNGKIIAVTASKSQYQHANKIIDAQNQYALFGLTDLHVHLGASGSNYSEYQYLPVEAHFNANLYLGVTSVVDLFTFKQTIDSAKQAATEQITPDFYYAGALFTNPGGHGTQFGGQVNIIEKDADIETLWKNHLAKNPHVTKAVIESFGNQGKTLTDKQLSRLGELSNQAGLPFFVHISTLEDGKRAIKAGATVLAHGVNSEAIDDEFIELMKQYDVAYIPTLSVYYNNGLEKDEKYLSHQKKLLPIVHQNLQNCLFKNVPSPSKWQQSTWQSRYFAYQNLIQLQKAGVVIGTGSDAGNPYTLHGLGLHNELDALAIAGLSNGEIINASTINAATILGREKNYGKIAPGYKANFLVIAENPLEDISALHNISMVIKDGQPLNREALATANQKIEPLGKPCHKKVPSKQAKQVIDDLNTELNWQTLSDNIMGGQSQATITLHDNILKISTSLGKAMNFGAWAGAELKFNHTIDASHYNGIEITYRGSQTPFVFSVYHQQVKDWDHFATPLPSSSEWKTVKVAFEQLKQYGYGSPVNWSASQLDGVSLMWRKMPGTEQLSDQNELEVSAIRYF
ncbi:CIA30 family protein [Thalassotalea ganghwensis]